MTKFDLLDKLYALQDSLRLMHCDIPKDSVMRLLTEMAKDIANLEEEKQ